MFTKLQLWKAVFQEFDQDQAIIAIIFNGFANASVCDFRFKRFLLFKKHLI